MIFHINVWYQVYKRVKLIHYFDKIIVLFKETIYRTYR